MEDLRTGPKLRSVTINQTSVEYELTPYELLMEDIRSKKYQLNKVIIAWIRNIYSFIELYHQNNFIVNIWFVFVPITGRFE